MAKNYSVYSFKDVRCVFNHPDIGQRILSDEGMGKITIQMAGDMSSHTQTANGYTVVNRLESNNGTVTIELPQNSPSDLFIQKALRYLKQCSSDRFALASVTVYDSASKLLYQADGVTPQKKPDRTFDTAAGMIAYAFLSANIEDQ